PHPLAEVFHQDSQVGTELVEAAISGEHPLGLDRRHPLGHLEDHPQARLVFFEKALVVQAPEDLAGVLAAADDTGSLHVVLPRWEDKAGASAKLALGASARERRGGRLGAE